MFVLTGVRRLIHRGGQAEARLSRLFTEVA